MFAEDDIARRRVEREAADRAYNEALTALDRALPKLPDLPHPPVAYDESQQRPSFITHRLPKPKTSISTGVFLMTSSTCASVSTRGNTARRMPNSRCAKLTAS